MRMEGNARTWFTSKQKAELWERWRRGQCVADIARALDRRNKSGIYRVLALNGGIAPAPRHRAAVALRLEEREEISRGIAAGGSIRRIAQGLKRSPSTVSREIRRNGGCSAYRASQADTFAWQRALRPKPCRLACAVSAAATVTPYLSTYRRGRSLEALCNPPYRPAGGNTTRDLFALLKPQRYRSSPAWSRSDSSIESQHPIDAALVPPIKRSRDVRHTLTALPALPELSLLLRREPYPCIPLHTHTSSSGKIRRCCVDRLNPQSLADKSSRAKVDLCPLLPQ